MVIYTGVKGYLDKISVKEVNRFEKEFLTHIKTGHKDILENIKKEQKITDEVESKLKKVILEFIDIFN